MYELPSFDHLMILNKSSPKAFETLRIQLVDGFIDTVPSERKRRLQGLQFHIDARRELAKNPMDSCISLSKMMHETFWDMHMSLEKLENVTAEPSVNRKLLTSRALLENNQTAKILPIIKSG